MFVADAVTDLVCASWLELSRGRSCLCISAATPQNRKLRKSTHHDVPFLLHEATTSMIHPPPHGPADRHGSLLSWNRIPHIVSYEPPKPGRLHPDRIDQRDCVQRSLPALPMTLAIRHPYCQHDPIAIYQDAGLMVVEWTSLKRLFAVPWNTRSTPSDRTLSSVRLPLFVAVTASPSSIARFKV